MPMIYGIPGQGHRPDDHDPDVAEYMDTVLAYNEPNQKEQSDISPEDAAFHYSELTQKYRDKVSNVINVIFYRSEIFSRRFNAQQLNIAFISDSC